MTRTEILHQTSQILTQAGIDDPSREARLLVCAALGVDGAELLARDAGLSADQEKKVWEWAERRAKREPLARIRGSREFWESSFLLNEATLEPRPESETLIELAMELFSGNEFSQKEDRTPLPSAYAKASADEFAQVTRRSLGEAGSGGAGGGHRAARSRSCLVRPSPLSPPEGRGNEIRILDLGTGTGCLLLSLLQEFLNATGTGTDQSARAVEAARENARALGFKNRARFICTNWAEGVEEKFDLVISNPPYIPVKDIPQLQAEVRLFDPAAALAGGADGLQAYREIALILPRLLSENGRAVVEIGQGQEEDVAAIFAHAGFKNIQQKKDLGGIIRALAFAAPL
ncbi:MAG: peptide chain release factor N(5)-glutamine methyltransferase [Proteobacteria bacterium]|nr:peptide chain release factor N(5)-glutamine methyltransferase [Pseudomonadota bacterium]